MLTWKMRIEMLENDVRNDVFPIVLPPSWVYALSEVWKREARPLHMERPLFALVTPVEVLDLHPDAGLDAGYAHLVLAIRPDAADGLDDAGAHGHLVVDIHQDVRLVQAVHHPPHFLMSMQTLWKPLRWLSSEKIVSLIVAQM